MTPAPLLKKERRPDSPGKRDRDSHREAGTSPHPVSLAARGQWSFGDIGVSAPAISTGWGTDSGTLRRKCGECKKEEKNEEETHEKLARKEAGGSSKTPATVPAIVHDVLRSPGAPLDNRSRSLMEPRFGRDFSHVRVHTDARAADSAHAVNALAYTVGSHVVFGAQKSDNLPLLAHELVHVVQNGTSHRGALARQALTIGEPDDSFEREADRLTPSLVGSAQSATNIAQRSDARTVHRWVSCDASAFTGMTLGADCPPREPGELARSHGKLSVGTIDDPETGEIVLGFAVGSADTSGLAADPTWRAFAAGIAAGTDHWEILGFTDCHGPEALNTNLRDQRARAVMALLTAAARANIDHAAGASTDNCVASNDTEQNRKFNRSVVFRRTVSTVTFSPDALTGTSCPPKAAITAAGLGDYISLMKCAEKSLGLSPREMLAVFRQLYYGKPWSNSTNSKWDQVIKCSPSVPDPRKGLTQTLFDSLKNSQEVDGVDVGHVFAGLEATTCPTSDVTFPVAKGLIDVTADTPNERFATWIGDLGAAAAAHVACDQLGAGAAAKGDCGNVAAPQSLGFYFTHHAPSQDLEGDIDPFIIRAAEKGITCQSSPGTVFSPSRAISDIFEDYYLNARSVAGVSRTNRYECLLQLIGASIVGKRVTNRSAIEGPLAYQVASFADLFFTKIKGGGVTDLSDASDRAHMRADAFRVVDLFIDYLESKL